MEFSDRLDSKCSSRSAKVSRELNKHEFQKTKDSLERCQDFNEKVMTKEEKEMKKQLERLERAKEKIERRRSSLINPDETLQQKSSSDLRRSSLSTDSKFSEKGILAQARSRRELIDKSLELSNQDSTETASTSKMPSPGRRKTICEDRLIHREKSSERRHSIGVAGEYDKGKTSVVGAVTTPNYKVQSFLKGKSTQIPKIVISDLTNSSESLNQTSSDQRNSLGSLYDMAVKAASVAEEGKTEMQRKDSLPGKKLEEKKSLPVALSASDTSRMDLMKLKELESLLKEARAYNERRNKDQHLGKTAERQQRKRLEYLMQLLEELHGKQKPDFTPSEILNCGYLRLSKSNVETLEQMIREAGKDPGIHIHSDTTNINIFENLQAERKDVIRQSPATPKSPSPTKGTRTAKHH